MILWKRRSFKCSIATNDETQQERWNESLEKATDQKTYAYLAVDAHTDNPSKRSYIKYQGNRSDMEYKGVSMQNVFLDEAGSWLEVGKNRCYCNRDLTEEEIKNLVDKQTLFNHPKCPLPYNEKTYAEFTKQINQTFIRYDINTCLRKAHFLAQTEAESDHFKTTVEYADGSDYEGRKDLGNINIGDGVKYKGRGMIQITGRNNYTKYLNQINRVDILNNPAELAESLELSFDSAGWYWTSGSAWGDMNSKADTDDLIAVSIGVNGGLNGYLHRKTNLKSILSKMKIEETCCNLKIKNLGVYKYSTSNIRNTKYGQRNKSKIQKFDD